MSGGEQAKVPKVTVLQLSLLGREIKKEQEKGRVAMATIRSPSALRTMHTPTPLIADSAE